MIRHLWLGDENEQLKKMNDARANDNASNTHRQPECEFTQQEFWIFFGLMLANRLYGGCKGEKMFEREVKEGNSADVNIFSANQYMSRK